MMMIDDEDEDEDDDEDAAHDDVDLHCDGSAKFSSLLQIMVMMMMRMTMMMLIMMTTFIVMAVPSFLVCFSSASFDPMSKVGKADDSPEP